MILLRKAMCPPLVRVMLGSGCLALTCVLAAPGPAAAQTANPPAQPESTLNAEELEFLRTLADAERISKDDESALLLSVESGRLVSGSAIEREALADALANCRSRRIISALITRTCDPALSAAEREAAAGAAVRAAALTRPPEDWLAWWEPWARGGEAEWQRGLADRLAAAQRAASAAEKSAEALVLDAYRRMLSLTPEIERGAVLADLLESPTEVLVRVGLELAMQTLLNGGAITEDVVEAAIPHLRHSAVGVQLLAARYIEQVRPEALADAAADLIAATASTELATVALRASSKVAGAGPPLAAIAPWVQAGAHEVRSTGDKALLGSAVRAAASAIADGDRNPEAITAIGAALASLADDQLPPSSVLILGEVGQPQRIGAVLRGSPESVAISAAQMLADDPRAIDVVVDAAAERPALRIAALSALARHARTPQGFLRALDLWDGREVDAESMDDLGLIASGLSLADIERIVAEPMPPRARVALLGQLARSTAIEGPPAPILGALLLELAAAHLALNNPASAVEAAAIAFPADELLDRRAVLLVESHLKLGNIKAAEAECLGRDVSKDIWIAALRTSPQPRDMDAMRAAILKLYAGELTAEELEALATTEVGEATIDPHESEPASGG